MRAARSAEDGLTLLELLVVLAILGLLAGVAVEAFRVAGGAWERGERRADEQQRLRVLYASIAQELAGVQPLRATFGGKRVAAFLGKSDRLTFFTAPDGQGDLPFSAMARGLSYFVEPGKGLLVQESYPSAEGDASKLSLEPKQGRAKVLDPRATRLKLRYLAQPDDPKEPPQWVEEWEPRDVNPMRKATRTDIGELPLAVEVTISLGDGVEPGVTPEKRQAVTFLFPIYVARRL